MATAENATTTAPIFIGGMMRSGTTLLRAMLGQHSAIASGLETHWFDWDWADPPPAERIARLAAFFDTDVATVRAQAAASASAEAFLDGFMRDYATAQGKRRWAEKTPGNVAVMERIFAFWPDAHLVHVRRDPKDVYASLRRSGKAGGPDGFAERWCAILGTAERDKGRFPRRYAEVLYEHLVTRPEAEMRRLLAFLGEAWEPAAARFEGKPEEFGKVLRVTGKRSDVLDRLSRPLGDESIGTWRSLPADEIEEVRRAVERRGGASLFARLEAETATAGAPASV
jgi:hypothetical protein